MTNSTYDLEAMIGKDRVARGLWWGKAWSLVEGCTPASEGCAHCWARQATHMRYYQLNPKMTVRYGGLTDRDGRWTGQVRLQEQDLWKPTPRQRPAVWSVWNDLFHEDVPDDFIDRAFGAMTLCPQHVFLVLSKRPERMREYMADRKRPRRVPAASLAMDWPHAYWAWSEVLDWPPSNVGIGVTVENDRHLDRIRILNEIPAALRFVSFEPLLGPIQLGHGSYLNPVTLDCHAEDLTFGVDWGIIGAESGGKRRECRIEWVRDLKDQLVAAGVKVFVKQLQVEPNRTVIHDMQDRRWSVELKRRQLPEISK